MTSPLRILFLEDSEDDILLINRHLQRGGYQIEYKCVDTEIAFREALLSSTWDLIISDYSLPGLNALTAIAIFKMEGPDIPFLVVSGEVGEETAVEVLKTGAHDVLIKNNLARLVPAVGRELREATIRRARRKTELDLHTSETKFRRIVETAQEGIWMLDRHGKTTYMNRRMAEMLAIRSEADTMISLLEIIVDPKIVDALAVQIHGDTVPNTTYRTQCRLRKVDGAALWGLLAFNSIPDDHGACVGHLAMIFDITEHRRLQEQLMVSDRMASVGMLAAGVAHEINNPLAAALTNLHLAIETLPRLNIAPACKADHQDLVEEIQDAIEASERLRSIVRDLKIFSRPPGTPFGPIDIRNVLESSLRMAWNELKHRAKIDRDFQPIPPVSGDESRLGQLFLNIIVNAAHAMDEGKANQNVLSLFTGVDDKGRAMVRIRDTGTGMSPDVLSHIFTPFYTTKAVGVGTGLGLSICHRIVQALGGEIRVESELGNGTTFHIFLPPAETSTPSQQTERVRRPVALASARILVIDDEPIVGTAIKRAMSKGHEVVIEQSARRALERIRSGESFDIILCDLMMPDMTGADFYTELYRLAPERAANMIFMTGGAFTPNAHAFLNSITNDRLEKPFDMALLKSIVQEHLCSVIKATEK
jgi:PAS domain S-box-containing protein